MDLLTAFLFFVASMLIVIITGHTMIIALMIGLVAFVIVGLRRGFSMASLTKMGITGIASSMIVIEIMCIIGFLTASWRASGTISIFVYYGIKLITPSLFLLIAFCLSCILSYAIGTSFGVAGTVGVIFMTLARSGGVDPIVTAGVLMSGVYFGDRNSPVSSSANMIAGITGTKIYDNVKIMLKTGAVPFLICLALYSVLSFQNPISHVDPAISQNLSTGLSLSGWAFVPALIMLVLPLIHIDVTISMILSISSAILIALFVQGSSIQNALSVCIFGYKGEGVNAMLNGGGLVSMLEIIGILVISSTYSGIFNGTHMLNNLQENIKKACNKTGRFPMTVIMSIAATVVFCNQTIASLICNDLMNKPYHDVECSNEELAIDLENSVILIGCFIPWSIGCQVPLGFFNVSTACMPYAVYMYAVPIFYLFAKNHWYEDRPVKKLSNLKKY